MPELTITYNGVTLFSGEVNGIECTWKRDGYSLETDFDDQSIFGNLPSGALLEIAKAGYSFEPESELAARVNECFDAENP